MKEIDNLENFPFVDARMLVGCVDLGKIGLNGAIAQAEAVFVERIISTPNAYSWKDTLATLPSVYIEAAINGEIRPNTEPPLLLRDGDVYIALSLGWKIALAKLNNVVSIQAMVLCYY